MKKLLFVLMTLCAVMNVQAQTIQAGQKFKESMNFIKYIMDGVHFKLIIIDQTICYVGSANLTGAGMGMKSATRRNFEAGILTDDPEIVNAAIEEFDKVWRGSECKKCQRRHLCPDPIA